MLVRRLQPVPIKKIQDKKSPVISWGLKVKPTGLKVSIKETAVYIL